MTTFAPPARRPAVFRITKNLELGGVQKRLSQLLPLLLPHFDVHVVVTGRRGRLADDLERAGVHVHHLPVQGKWNPVAIWRIASLLRRHKADIVHGHSRGGIVLGVLAGALAGVPVRIGHVHSRGAHWLADSRWGIQRQILLETLVHKLGKSHVFCVSEETRDHFLEQTGLPASRVSLLYNGVALPEGIDKSRAAAVRERYAITPDSVVLGFVGRLTWGKGLDFIEAMAAKLARNTAGGRRRHVFFIVGRGSEKTMTSLRKTFAPFAQHGVDLVLAGEQADAGPFYQAFDLLIFPSQPQYEGFGAVMLEAAAHGLPILTRQIAPAEELQRHYSRMYRMADAEDPSAALDALLALPPDPGERFAAMFSIESMAQQTIEHYRRLLAEAAGDPRGRRR